MAVRTADSVVSTMTPDPAPPRIAVLSIGFGLVLMSVFTVAWSFTAPYGWDGVPAAAPPVVAVLAALVFLARATQLFAAARHYPPVTSDEDAARGKRMGIAYGVVFGTEGAVIGITVGVLAGLGLDDYTVPAIALVVGLHFLPMARIFDRTVDHWIAGWVVGVAAVGIGILAVAGSWAGVPALWSAVGVGTALGTAAYGVFMWLEARDVLARDPTRAS